MFYVSLIQKTMKLITLLYPRVPSFALIISAINSLYIILRDRFVHLKISINVEIVEDDHFEWIEKRLWINIANHSDRKIFVTHLSVECSKLFPPFRRHRIELNDLQRWENNKPEPAERFWIESWGNALLSADAGDLELDVLEHFKAPTSLIISYQAVLRDGLGKLFRSNKINLRTLPHPNPNKVSDKNF